MSKHQAKLYNHKIEDGKITGTTDTGATTTQSIVNKEADIVETPTHVFELTKGDCPALKPAAKEKPRAPLADFVVKEKNDSNPS